MSDARSNYEHEICSPRRRITTDIERTPPRRIVLLRRSDGTVVDRNAPRDFRSYDGRGASKALLLAIDRQSAQLQAAHDRGDTYGAIAARARTMTLHVMALSQIEREQAREGMVVA